MSDVQRQEHVGNRPVNGVLRPALFGWDEDDGAEVLAAPAWQRARAAAYSGTPAFGAPDILRPDQNVELARPWISVFGSP